MIIFIVSCSVVELFIKITKLQLNTTRNNSVTTLFLDKYKCACVLVLGAFLKWILCLSRIFVSG